MERGSELKVLPRTMPILLEVSSHTAAAREADQRLNGYEVSGAGEVSARELNQFSRSRDVPVSRLASIREVAQLSHPRVDLVREDMGFGSRSSQESLSFEPIITWKGKAFLSESEDLISDVDTLKESRD